MHQARPPFSLFQESLRCDFAAETQLVDAKLTSIQGLEAAAQRLTRRKKTVYSDGLQPNSDGLQPTSNGLRPTSDGLQPNSDDLLPHSDGLHPKSEGLQPTY